MKVWFLVYFYFVRAFLTHVLGGNPKTKFAWASKNLFRTTFRIPESERKNSLLVLTQYIRFLKICFQPTVSNKETATYNTNGAVYVYDVFSQGIEGRVAFCNYFANEKMDGAIFKTNLGFSNSIGMSVLMILSSSIILPFVFIASLFFKDKAPYATLWKELIENYQLIRTVNNLKVKTIYYFCIFEKDANLAALLLNRNGIQVNKIPSEVPIALWNKVIIADKLCVCNGYQFDELENYKSSIFVGKTEFWGPELILENIEKYNKPLVGKKETIGFYSTGAWVRKREDHIDQGVDMEANEEILKLAIKEYCLLHPTIELLIYLHPRERWDKYYQEAIEKYSKIFEGITYSIVDKQMKSTSSFELVNLGIAFQSTLVYERLYCGFKTLLMPLSFKDFPVKNSPMKNICAFSKEELFEKITQNFKSTNKEFFISNGIEHYAKFLFN